MIEAINECKGLKLLREGNEIVLIVHYRDDITDKRKISIERVEEALKKDTGEFEYWLKDKYEDGNEEKSLSIYDEKRMMEKITYLYFNPSTPDPNSDFHYSLIIVKAEELRNELQKLLKG